jgi:hypothetical protein
MLSAAHFHFARGEVPDDVSVCRPHDELPARTEFRSRVETCELAVDGLFGRQTITIDTKGAYRFPGLAPRTYALTNQAIDEAHRAVEELFVRNGLT